MGTVVYRGNTLLAFLAWFTPLQVIAVAARVYARRLTARPRDLDDLLVFLALLSQLAGAGIAIGFVKQGGIGYHLEWVMENNPKLLTALLKYQVAISAWYYATINLSKLAICVLYRTIFPQKWVHYTLYGTATILVLNSVVCFAATLAACKPFDAQWAAPSVQAQSCIDKQALYVWSTFPNIVTDIVLLVLPQPIIWRLHANTRLRLALAVTFIVGSIGLVASTMRFATFAKTSSFRDPSYHGVELIIWTIAEPGISLIAACLLTYRPFLDGIGSRIQRHIKTSRRSRTLGAYANNDSLALKPTQTSTIGNIPSRKSDHGTGVHDQKDMPSSIGTRGDGFAQLSDQEELLDYDGPRSSRSKPDSIVKTATVHISYD